MRMFLKPEVVKTLSVWCLRHKSAVEFYLSFPKNVVHLNSISHSKAYPTFYSSRFKTHKGRVTLQACDDLVYLTALLAFHLCELLRADNRIFVMPTHSSGRADLPMMIVPLKTFQAHSHRPCDTTHGQYFVSQSSTPT